MDKETEDGSMCSDGVNKEEKLGMEGIRLL